ncbi:sugar phosphate isomerase/epimerase [Candidatus Poribacteria bacterium]|nr:sugar phosphate isomerase/epimerase [Candidatus Poribacteria bacterium]MBT5536976.1 sugar phosphate isomerase/epimerase [Candidatus Poribacteria bacterium]MBT5710999.1 sugar phosphate isomerase/epimerase [Candidatus Poribacteria bacterium]MBT7097412.1 sugar phosphate isomerase/epimerase [Candidatus Poribacteria bacterium]MBT7803946.1 sugar phosphate isomerase/epimerase [Candidatus Poribacteria bacterium]
MRLGGFFSAATRDDLERVADRLDCYGLAAIPAPGGYHEWPDAECSAYGEEASRLDIVIGECGYWANLLVRDGETRATRINDIRARLAKAEVLGCGSVVSLVGSAHPSGGAAAPDAYNYSDACKDEFREIVLRILDGLSLDRTKYIIEPWHNTFFYKPADIAEFIDRVDHPAFGLHLDLMNMISQETFYDTTGLARETFALLSDHVASVHLKDAQFDASHHWVKWDEVDIGDGVMDYEAYLTGLAELDEDMPCYCEHMSEEREYALNFARLHHLAKGAGVAFRRRAAVA